MKKDLYDRIKDIPTTIMGFIIVIIGLFFVYKNIINIEQLSGFLIASLPFFLYKKETKKED